MENRKNLLQTLGDWWVERQSQPADPSTAPSTGSGRAAPLLRWLTPNGGTIILILLLVFTQNIWARPALETAGTPGPSGKTISYQGRLTDSGGSPRNGNFAMTFALYNAATAGTLVWGPESHPSVTVSNGLFSVGLGSQTSGGIPTTVWNGDIYLQVTVGGETLTPRELIRSVPIAGMALTVPDGAITSNKISDYTLMRTFSATGTKIQYGAFGYESDTCDSQVVTFPQSFSTTPHVFISQNEASAGFGGFITAQTTTTQFRIHKMYDNHCDADAIINWTAIGN